MPFTAISTGYEPGPMQGQAEIYLKQADRSGTETREEYVGRLTSDGRGDGIGGARNRVAGRRCTGRDGRFDRALAGEVHGDEGTGRAGLSAYSWCRPHFDGCLIGSAGKDAGGNRCDRELNRGRRHGGQTKLRGSRSRRYLKRYLRVDLVGADELERRWDAVDPRGSRRREWWRTRPAGKTPCPVRG